MRQVFTEDICLHSSCLEFMSRQEAQERLLQKPPGTFIIRFSDGEIGAVTIAWCYQTSQGMFSCYNSCKTFESSDFTFKFTHFFLPLQLVRLSMVFKDNNM